jgi:N-acetylglucosamine-6-sulfatase
MAQAPKAVAVFLAVLAGLTAAGSRGDAARGTGAEPAKAPPPNIVVLMTDDLDTVSFEAALDAGLLPHIRGLFAPGVRFDQSFVSESLCCPSRSTYLTGLYPHNHGVVRNQGFRGGFAAFMAAFGENNLGTWMQAAGYRTALFGKYLNGYGDGRFVPRGWDDWQALVDPSMYCMYNYNVSNNGQPVRYGHRAVRDYQTDVLAGLAADFILARRAEGDSRPLFLHVAPTAPHREQQCFDGIRPAPRHASTPPLPQPKPPSFNEADMSDKPAWMQALPLVDETAMGVLYNQRIASMRAVDDMLGRIVRALRAVRELNRTVFVFTSDNGYLLGRHRWEAKTLVYEESIRVPLLVRGPSFGGPKAVEEIVLNNDLAPTIAALAGASPRLVTDGRSLLPLLEGKPTPWRKRFLAAFPPLASAPESDDPEIAEASSSVSPFLAVRSGQDGDLSDLLYVETLNAFEAIHDEELYDLRPDTDPFQIASRHDDPAYAAKKRRLRQHLDALKSCGNGTCQALEE